MHHAEGLLVIIVYDLQCTAQAKHKHSVFVGGLFALPACTSIMVHGVMGKASDL